MRVDTFILSWLYWPHSQPYGKAVQKITSLFSPLLPCPHMSSMILHPWILKHKFWFETWKFLHFGTKFQELENCKIEENHFFKNCFINFFFKSNRVDRLEDKIQWIYTKYICIHVFTSDPRILKENCWELTCHTRQDNQHQLNQSSRLHQSWLHPNMMMKQYLHYTVLLSLSSAMTASNINLKYTQNISTEDKL